MKPGSKCEELREKSVVNSFKWKSLFKKKRIPVSERSWSHSSFFKAQVKCQFNLLLKAETDTAALECNPYATKRIAMINNMFCTELCVDDHKKI